MKNASPLLLLALCLVGCGGNGSGGNSGNPYIGAYRGNYTESNTGTVGNGFAPPATGLALGTVDTDGSLDVELGTGYAITGMVSNKGVVSNVVFTYPDPADTTRSLTASGTVGIEKNGQSLTVTADVPVNGGAGAAHYTATFAQTG